MTNEIMFCQAVETGNVEVVKNLIGGRAIDPNQFYQFYPDLNCSAIDLAVLHGHVEVVDYLFTQTSKETSDERKSFLYYICRASARKRPVLLEWLKSHYQLLTESVGTSHLNAVIGVDFDATDKTLHGGLSAMHYAVLVANKNLALSDSLALLNQPIESGYFQGVTLAWLLADEAEWDLLKDLAAKTAIPIDLNVAPIDEGHACRNMSLAWVLAHYGKSDLLKDLAAKTAIPIDLNVAPTDEGHGCRNMSLAWLLADEAEWDLLKDLAAKAVVPVDLNTAPTHHGNISLALLLAHHGQWDLLKDLAAKTAIPIDLNVVPTDEGHAYRNMSLAWLLADDGQWDLLKDLAAKTAIPIDLNVAPTDEGDANRNISLAWLLADDGQWDLLKDLVAQTTRSINLSAGPIGQNGDMNTLNELLIANKQWDLLEQVVKTHIYDEGVNQVFEMLHKYEHQINDLLSGDEIAVEVIVDVVTHFFTTLNQITPQTGDSCYNEAQAIKGRVLLIFLDKGAQICTLICEQFPDEVNRKDFTVVNDEDTLLAEAISDFTSGAESGLVRLLTKDHLKEKETLQSLNEELQHSKDELQCKYDELQRRCETLEQQLNIQPHSQQTCNEDMIYAEQESSHSSLNRMFFSEPRREQFFQGEGILTSGEKKRKASTGGDSLYEEYNENNEPSPKHKK